jgi:two-component system OmpR family response regulator
MRLLVVEDDVKLAELLKRGLVRDGYAVDHAANVTEATWLAHEQPYDAIVLDVMLPDGNGVDLCAALRAEHQWTPVILLTARQTVPDRIAGLDAGADDYLAKPFALDELLARLRAVIRRGPVERPTELVVDQLVLNPGTHEVRRGDVAIELTPTEFRLLAYLMRHAGEALSRSQIIAHVWDFAFEPDSNVVDVYVRYLRDKVDRPFATHHIETVRGVGYRLRNEPTP